MGRNRSCAGIGYKALNNCPGSDLIEDLSALPDIEVISP